MTPPEETLMEPCKFEKEISDNGKCVVRLEEQIIALQENLRGAFAKIAAHIDSGNGWRMAIVGSVLMVFLQIMMVSYYAGKIVKSVEELERKIRLVQTVPAQSTLPGVDK